MVILIPITAITAIMRAAPRNAVLAMSIRFRPNVKERVNLGLGMSLGLGLFNCLVLILCRIFLALLNRSKVWNAMDVPEMVPQMSFRTTYHRAFRMWAGKRGGIALLNALWETLRDMPLPGGPIVVLLHPLVYGKVYSKRLTSTLKKTSAQVSKYNTALHPAILNRNTDIVRQLLEEVLKRIHRIPATRRHLNLLFKNGTY
ncbi:hypothetical protein QBC44DRAFT_311401 [Cladorrhinum sp. PSN332]|nr:hypothetical protein QBC44DRAFT_311401 [Cladorrhinum sp. PSN332]